MRSSPLAPLLAAVLASASCTTSSNGGGAVITTGGGAGDPGPGGVRFAASGEALAIHGYAFPPRSDSAAVFVDGWDVHFTRLLVTLDDVTLSENPDKVPGDQSQTDGLVARLTGPWAIDLARSDPSYLAGKGGPGELAVPFESIAPSSSLKTDGTRYAFGFDAVPASASAKLVNLDGPAQADYQRMIANGCVVLYVGHASFKGNKADPSCYPTDRHDFADEIDFELCFKSPTSYVNCQSPDNSGKPFDGEEHPRGIAPRADSSVIAQATFHTDHPFWDSVLHDSPAHFDPFAARASGPAGGVAKVTLEDTKGVDYTEVTDTKGNALQWRYCVDPGDEVHPKLTGTMRLDPQSVPHASSADPATGLRDLYDFATYNQSTQGHLDSDGLCFVRRNYRSPR